MSKCNINKYDIVIFGTFLMTDMIFNKGRLTNCVAKLLLKFQHEREENLKSLDNNYFGC